MPRPVKFNTVITQNNPQSQQQSEISANAEEQLHEFQDSDMAILGYPCYYYTHK